jgi:penicillin-binding protein-related factor A (putative recombinase)
MAYYMNNSGRKSIPLSYLESKGLEIEVEKLRVNVRLNIEKFIKEVK